MNTTRTNYINKEAFYLSMNVCFSQFITFTRYLDRYELENSRLNRYLGGKISFSAVELDNPDEELKERYNRSVHVAIGKLFSLNKAFRAKGYNYIVTKKLETIEEMEDVLDEASVLLRTM